MNITINLPVETINTIIDIDDKRVEVPISQYVQKFTDEEYQVRTMFSIPDSTEKIITYSHDIDFITELTKNEVGNTNNIRYFKVIAKYYNNKEFEFVVPGYVKFYSKTIKNYVPVEFVKKSDMLIDYQGYNVQITSNEPVEFKATEYYSIQINSPADVVVPFYLNGILSYISYNNFNIKEISNA